MEAGADRRGWTLAWSDGIVRLSASSRSRTSVMETINPISEEEFRKRCVFMPEMDLLNFMECANGAWRHVIKRRKHRVVRHGRLELKGGDSE